MKLSDPIFTDADKAREHLERTRWPHDPECPHCGVVAQATKLNGKAARPGVYQCNACREQFTVTVGTVFERSKVPLNKWLLATFLMSSSKEGISAHQLARMLGVTYKTAWFMAHRIRAAMAPAGPTALGGEGKFVEADAAYIGGKERNKHASKRNSKAIGGAGKQIVHTLVERDGRARSHQIANVSGDTLCPLIFTTVDRKSSLMTDTAGGYLHIGREFTRHEMVDHGRDEYVRGDAHSTPRKATSPSSSAASTARSTTSQRRTCTVTSRSSISATRSAKRSAWTTPPAPTRRCARSPASA